MILQILQLTLLDITTHKIGNPVSLLTADLNENDNSITSTTKDVLQPKVTGKLQRLSKLFFYGMSQRKAIFSNAYHLPQIKSPFGVLKQIKTKLVTNWGFF